MRKDSYKNKKPIVFSKKTIWIIRLVLLFLFTVWVSGGFYLYAELQKSTRALELARIEAQKKEESLRREVQLKRVYSQERQNPQDSVMNAAVDGFKK